MKPRRWSVATRVAWWFVVTNTIVFLGLSGLSRFLILREMAREGEDPAAYHFEGTVELFEALGRSPAEFTRLMREVGVHDLQVPIGMRIVDGSTGETISEFFHPGLPEKMIPTTMRKGSFQIEDDLRWHVDDLDENRVMGLLLPGFEDSLAVSTELDPFAQVEFVQRYQESLIWFAALAAVASALVGAFLGRRISRSLKAVAANVRAASEHSENTAALANDAPDEVLDVSTAMNETLARIHDSQRRSRLLIAGLTHELSAPVQNLISEGEIGMLRSPDVTEDRRVLQSMLEESRALGRVLHNLMTLVSQTESGAVGHETFDLREELQLRLDEEHRRAASRGITLQFEASGPAPVCGDREAIVLAIRNVVDNAIKWSRDGALVQVRVDILDDRIEVAVDDQGPGIAASDRAVIFEAFRQVKRDGDARAGYGMGLALAKAAVDAQRGRIDVESCDAGGARFRILLPQRLPTDR